MYGLVYLKTDASATERREVLVEQIFQMLGQFILHGLLQPVDSSLIKAIGCYEQDVIQ